MTNAKRTGVMKTVLSHLHQCNSEGVDAISADLTVLGSLSDGEPHVASLNHCRWVC